MCSESLQHQLLAAKAHISRLEAELAEARRGSHRSPDLFSSIQEFRRSTFERLGAFSLEDHAHQLRLRLTKAEVDPKKRQAVAVFMVFALLPMSLFLTAMLLWLTVRYANWPLLAALLCYFAHIYLDRRSSNGGAPRRWVKDHWFWRRVTEYFPMELRKMNPETVFPTDALYMFGYHPHGLFSAGCFLNFMTSATGFPALFPKLDIRGCTLAFNFRLPFFREVLLSLGAIDVSAASIRYQLKSGPGSAVVIVPGGAAEALDARPGTNDLTLRRRQGFFRLALQHGVHLVPVYSFGENELYEQLDNKRGSMIRWLQEFLQRNFGYSAPFFLGAGSQPVGCGCSGQGVPLSPMPRRHPVITVVGDPIPCERVENPTNEQIDVLKEVYIMRLKEIFDRFADQYAPKRNSELRIVK